MLRRPHLTEIAVWSLCLGLGMAEVVPFLEQVYRYFMLFR